MVNRAISDFVEAVSGHNRNMQWSLSPEIMMRSVKPVLNRLYEGKLTAEQAITVAMDYTAPRVKNNIGTCQDLFSTLDARLEATLNGDILPAQTALNELFLGLNEEFNWTTDPHFMADELRPTFTRVSMGELVPEQAVMLFVDNMRTRTEAMLGIIQDLVIELSQQFQDTMKIREGPKAVNGND